jgi:hypothetical protein
MRLILYPFSHPLVDDLQLQELELPCPDLQLHVDESWSFFTPSCRLKICMINHLIDL